MRTNTRTLLLTAAIAVSAIASANLTAQPLLLYYDFNSVADHTVNTVTDASGNNNTGTIGGFATWGADKSGVSGKSGDYAFDNTATSGMAGANGGVISAPAFNTALTSFTVSMWFKTDEVLSGSARLFNTGQGFLLAGTDDGKLSFNGRKNGESSGSSQMIAVTNDIFKTQNEWIFVAVTYDGTGSTSSVAKMYVGTATTGVIEIGSVTSTATFGAKSLGSLFFGATSASVTNAFDGWLDDIRLYGATSGASGALTLEQLEAIRLSAAPIPEPASATAVLAAFAVAAVFAIGIARKTRAK